MQVEEPEEQPEEHKPTIQQQLDYYLDNFGGKDNPIVFQGELYRFKPGIQHNFITRWVQVSAHAFRYFKNFYTAQGSSKPIVAVPNQAIIKIVPFTQLNKEAYTKTHCRNEKERDLEIRLFDNMFEIVLDQDYEKIFRFREIDAQHQREEYGSSSRIRVSSQGTKPGSAYSTI